MGQEEFQRRFSRAFWKKEFKDIPKLKIKFLIIPTFMRKREDYIEVIDEYDEKGCLVKRTANGVNMPIPEVIKGRPLIAYFQRGDKKITSCREKRFWSKEE